MGLKATQTSQTGHEPVQNGSLHLVETGEVVQLRRYKKSKGQRRFLFPKSLILLVLLGLAGSAFLPQYLQALELKKEITRLENEKSRLEQERTRLEEERIVVLSDDYVERMAREQLGFVRRGETLLIHAASGKPRPLKGKTDPSSMAVR